MRESVLHCSIEITGSGLRGLQNFTMDFRYPLAVIAGKNGVGKSTILACAACAYQNRTTFKSLLNEEQYYNFHDFLITGWGDTAPQDVIVTWTHRLQDNSISIVPAHKEQGRWRGYRRRPSRPTDFIGTIRAVHPCEFKVLRSRFETTAAIPHQDLSNDQRACVGVIVGRTYTSVKVGNSGRHRLHRLHCGPSEYSAFNAGSGEDISCLLIRALTNLPDGGLLIVEEIETGLHASACEKAGGTTDRPLFPSPNPGHLLHPLCRFPRCHSSASTNSSLPATDRSGGRTVRGNCCRSDE